MDIHIPPQLDTLPKQFMDKVRKYGDRKVAVRQKGFGIWREFTWQDSYENVRDLTLGLVALGLERGQRSTIVGDNDRQYLWADFAIMSGGGLGVGIFTDSTPAEIEYIINHSEAVIAFAKDQEQCDKLLDIKDRIPTVKQVIYWEDKGMWHYSDPWLISYAEVQAMGHKLHGEQPSLFHRLVAEGKASDLANFCYTSGTTGQPKGTMLTHENLLAAAIMSESVEPRFDTDDLLSFLPLAWIAEHTLAVTPHAVYGIVLNFPESPETVQQNIREIAPDVVFYPARLWENLTAQIQIRITDTDWLNRMLYRLFLPFGYRMADHLYAGKKPGPFLALAYGLGDLLVFKPLRCQLGLNHIRSALTAGAALGPDMMRYFRALGLNLKQVFATTETTAIGTQHLEDDVDFDSVGVPCQGIAVRITDEGEIWLGGPNIFMGYYKNEEATRKALSVDEHGTRWFHTGDAGYLNDRGHVIYLDRVKDMIELRNGERFSPQYIEGRLKFSPYIRDAMTIGGVDRDFATALIAIDFENVGRWAEKNRLTYTTFVDLSQRPQVYDLIKQDIERVNRSLPPSARVQKFILLHKEFDADEAEMTRTRKLRRGFLAERYGSMIEAMYNSAKSVRVSAIVHYRDGRETTVETEVRVMSLEEEPRKEAI